MNMVKKVAYLVFCLAMLTGLVSVGCAKAATPKPTSAPTVTVSVTPTTTVTATLTPKPTVSPSPAPTPTPTPKPAVVLKALTSQPMTSLLTSDLQEYIKAINEKAKGELVINFVGGTEVIPDLRQPAALREGVYDMTISFPGYYQDVLPESLLTQLTERPYYQLREPGGFYDKMNELHKAVNLYWLGSMGVSRETHGYRIFTNVPVKDPRKDFKGQRIRLLPDQKPFVGEALGSTVVTLPFPEMYTALERGVADGIVMTTNGIRGAKLYEVLKYMVFPPIWGSSTLVLMSRSGWEKLSKPLQDLMVTTMVEWEKGYEKLWDGRNKDHEQFFLKQGMKFIEFSPEDTKWYQDAATTSYREYTLKQVPEQSRYLLNMIIR